MNLAFAAFKTLVLLLVWPPVPFLLLILVAWFRHGRRGASALLWLGVLGIWLSCTEAAGEFLTQVLLSPPPALNLARLPKGPPTAVLVLGAGVRTDSPEYGGPALKDLTGERLQYGVWLSRRTGWPLGFSGGIGWTALDQVVPESVVAAQVAITHYGVPLRWTESRSRDTRENASDSLPMLAGAGIKRVILVTHDAHMPRALRAFQAAAAPLQIEIVPAPVGLRRDAYASFADWCPSESGFARVRYAVYESLAALTGR